MKKQLLTLIALTIVTVSCSKKKDDNVAIDMTLKTYKADAKYGTLPVILQLNFESNGTAKLRSFPSNDVVLLNYEVGDKKSANTTLRIYGELDKTLTANGFTQGTKINWTANISRLGYNAEIVGFTAGEYHFTSY